MTDSQTSLFLVAAYMVRPYHLKFNKHNGSWQTLMLPNIAQNIMARTAPVRLSKVRAHSRVQGNELADSLAAAAHAADNACTIAFEDPGHRGPAWVQAPFESDLNQSA